MATSQTAAPGDPAASDHAGGKDAATSFEAGWRVLVFVVLVMMTFPSLLNEMWTGLDASWVVALNEAASRHLAHGRDIAFTYGPLGFVIHPLDLGTNLAHAVPLRLGLNVLWWTSVALLLLRIRGYAATFLFAAAAWYSGIAFDLSVIVLLTAIGYLILAHLDGRLLWAVPAAVVSAAAVLAKFNIGVACTGALLVWAGITWLGDRRPRMLGRLGLLALCYVATLVGLFQVYGGPISALAGFLRSSGQIGSGYSSQMSLRGPVAGDAVPAVVLGSAIIAAVVGIRLRARFTPALWIILFPLFVLYKGATVRQDFGHLSISGPPMVGLVAFLLAMRSGRRPSWSLQAIVAVGLLGVVWCPPPSWSVALDRGASNWVRLCNFARTRAECRAVDARVKEELAIPARMRARIGEASVDVYPWDLCYITANGLNWRPRYVFQSYSAYDPALDRRCADGYRSEDAPQYILYSHKAIDRQHPCIVDPRTWMEIYRWYAVVDEENRLLLLKRRVRPRWDGMDALGTGSLVFGQRWEVPQGIEGPVVLRAKLRLSALGRLRNALYKVYPPRIRIEYEDGTVAEHRLVWKNVRSGFLVSSLPREESGVRQLLDEGSADRVRAVTFVRDRGCFEREFSVAWSRARLSTDREGFALGNLRPAR
jgi:hypothetical protein